MTLSAFILCLAATAALIGIGRWVQAPTTDAAAAPTGTCAICEAPTAEPGARCSNCGAAADEEPLHREGGTVITWRRLVVGGRSVPLELGAGTTVTIATRLLPSGATDGMGCSLFAGGVTGLLGLLNSGNADAAPLMAMAVAAFTAFPYFLVRGLVDPPAVEHTVRVARGGRAWDVYVSRDPARARALAGQLRRLAAAA